MPHIFTFDSHNGYLKQQYCWEGKAALNLIDNTRWQDLTVVFPQTMPNPSNKASICQMPVNAKNEDIYFFIKLQMHICLFVIIQICIKNVKMHGYTYISHQIANIHVRKYEHTAYMGEAIVHTNDHYQLQLIL